jgi:acylglycerol lipase
MKHIEGNFRGARNINIYYQAWLPDGKAKAVILIVHGIGEHSGRYMNVVNRFAPLGFALYGLDHIGHGKSDGPREMVERFGDFTDTLAMYSNMVASLEPGKPLFILGHSMGGLIASSYLLDHQSQFKGAILSGPAVKVADNITKATIFFGKIIAALAPRLGLIGLDVNCISRDPEVVRVYVEDPLVFHRKTPARLASELLKAMLRVQAEASKITLPFIVLQGGKDEIVNPKGAQMLFEAASSADKTIKVYDELFHEVFNEPEHDRVLADVEEWLSKRV